MPVWRRLRAAGGAGDDLGVVIGSQPGLVVEVIPGRGGELRQQCGRLTGFRLGGAGLHRTGW